MMLVEVFYNRESMMPVEAICQSPGSSAMLVCCKVMSINK